MAQLHVLVTAGPTREHIDDIRYLTNLSTGRMGFALARAAIRAGHRVTLVCGPTPIEPPEEAEVVPVVSALQMREAVLAAFGSADAVFMTAAVADYRPETRLRGKRKKEEGPWDLRLVRNPDILREISKSKGRRVLVGFALEAEKGEENARRKLEEKRLDLIVLNAPAAMGADLSDFTLIHRAGATNRYISVSKDFLAQSLVSLVTNGRLLRGR